MPNNIPTPKRITCIGTSRVIRCGSDGNTGIHLDASGICTEFWAQDWYRGKRRLRAYALGKDRR